MSGGYFNYMDSQLKSEVFGWSDQWWSYGLKKMDGKLLGWLAYRRKTKEGDLDG